jgi:hypothetical protein
MAEAKKKDADPTKVITVYKGASESAEILVTDLPTKVITVYKGASESAEIPETDLQIWQKAGFSAEKPITQLSVAEQWAMLKRSTGANL